MIEFAENWGIDAFILLKSYEQFSIVEKDIIPYIDEISKSLDYSKAKNKESENPYYGTSHSSTTKTTFRYEKQV